LLIEERTHRLISLMYLQENHPEDKNIFNLRGQ